MLLSPVFVVKNVMKPYIIIATANPNIAPSRNGHAMQRHRLMPTLPHRPLVYSTNFTSDIESKCTEAGFIAKMCKRVLGVKRVKIMSPSSQAV